MNDIATNSQGAFLKGHQIMDGILVANDRVDSWRRLGRLGLICKPGAFFFGYSTRKVLVPRLFGFD